MRSNEQDSGQTIQLWSQNYEPEPQGVAPVVGSVARKLASLGSDVTVATTHPHYPDPVWGSRLRPYRETRDGVNVLRLPIWPGRDSGLQRIRQDLSSTIAGNLVAPFLPPADAVIAVSPSLPGLSAAMLYAGLRRVPWILWLQDIVTDGAVTTGELTEDHPALKAARVFERRAYRSADRIVVISGSFRERLLKQGVPDKKISLLYNPSSRDPVKTPFASRKLNRNPTILAMGNIGRTQGLESMVEAFEANTELEAMNAEMMITGSGVAIGSVRKRVRTGRVQTPGVLESEDLDRLLTTCHLGLVSQKADLQEFNLPSKLMNYLSFGIPVIASVEANSETARIVRESGSGWVTDPARPEEFAERAALVLADPAALRKASAAGMEFAGRRFHPDTVGRAFADLVLRVTSSG